MANNEWLEKWAVALESGEFQQGKNVLRQDEVHYCCLGVICELIYREQPIELDRDERSGSFSYEGSNSFLPKKVANFLQVNPCNVVSRCSNGVDLLSSIRGMDSYIHPATLSELNDNGTSFADIAKEVRKLKDA